MSEKEKGIPYTIDNVNSNQLHTQDNLETLPERGSQERAVAERNLIKKLDARLLPTIFFIFIMNNIDVRFFLKLDSSYPFSQIPSRKQRSSITTARLKGLQQDLHISGNF